MKLASIKIIVSLALALVVVDLSRPVHAANANPAKDILQKAGLAGGVACIAPAGDGETALTLARQPRWLVYASDPDPAKVESLRAKAVAAGVLGRSLYVERSGVDRLPFADNLVDLVIATGTTPQAELLRVLTPVRGRAIIGDKTLTKPALPGADDWTHRLHGPDNNPVSADTSFRMPARLQYLAMPMQTSFQGSLLVANGRRIELSDWVSKKPDRNAVAGKLLARSLYNGQVLWERELPKVIEADEPIVALDGDRIYLAADDACHVRVMDAETGAELPALTVGNGALRVKWLGIENGRLYTLVGMPLPARPALSFVTHNRDIRQKRAEAGHSIIAWDLQAGRALWRHEESATIDYRTIAVRHGRTYFYSEKTRLACLDPAGKLAWENRQVESLTRPNRIVNVNIESVPTLIVGPAGVLRLAVPGGQEGLLFSTTDGKLLWKDQRRAPNSFFVDDRYYGPKSFYESATGKELGEASHEGGGCGMVTWVPGMQAGLSHVALGMKSPCGVGAYAAGGMVLFAPSQCDCWPHLRGAAGFIAAGELIPAHPLETGAALAPMLAAKSNDWPQYRGNVWRTGEAAISLGQSAQVRWVAKAVQSLPVPAGHELQRMEWLDRPTPPVTAGGLAFYGVSDGSLRAVKTVDGQPAWTFWTGGAVLTSPAVSGGRVYAGSADGWVYCLDAATGQLAWRWRGAPAERRIMIYGKLMSSWPVTAVLVDQGVLYGVAGQWMQNGSVTFALDATTGKPHWQTWTGPNWDGRKFLQGENPGFGPAGQLALVGNNLWVRTYLGLPAAFEKATGRRVHPTDELIQLQARQEWSFGVRLATAGQDILVVNDRLVLQGGQPLLVNPDIRHDKSAARFIAYYLNERGQIPVKPLSRPAIPSSQVAPAISGKQLLIVGGIGRSWRSENSTIGLSLWSLDVWQKEFESATSEGGVADDEAADASAKAGKKKWEARKSSPAEQDLRSGFCLALDMKKAIWRADSADISAIALGPDAAVAVVGEPKTKGKLRYGESPAYEGWKLIAFDRASGKERWSAALPGEPVFNGLAPAGDGSWVVTLRDGALAIVSGARASAR